jgi:hypothetical protein
LESKIVLPSSDASLGLNPNGYFEGEWSRRKKPACRPTPAGERALATRLHLPFAHRNLDAHRPPHFGNSSVTTKRKPKPEGPFSGDAAQ